MNAETLCNSCCRVFKCHISFQAMNFSSIQSSALHFSPVGGDITPNGHKLKIQKSDTLAKREYFAGTLRKMEAVSIIGKKNSCGVITRKFIRVVH